MIIGAAGGVGSIATQLAKHAGLTVIGTASRPESVKWVKELGADEVINHFEPFVPQLQALGYEHVDYIFCLNTAEKHWKNMGTRLMFHTEDMIEQHHLLNALADLIDQGVIRSTVAEKLSPINAANLRKAHALIETGRTIGKVVLEHFS